MPLMSFLSQGVVANSIGVCGLGYIYCTSSTYTVTVHQVHMLYVRYVLRLVVIMYMADVGILVCLRGRDMCTAYTIYLKRA